MKETFEFARCHLTKILGYAQAIVAALSTVQGLIDPRDLPKWMAVLAVLTVLRGHTSPVQPQVKQ